ncbi:hypothetical protein JOC47_000791 [Halanaerobacter jeridensis]|uniref:Uncharacterized protein n=2 Tax=Halanaerobacter jeridensis TaxID=706427 RepID=A0A938XNW6_9FIRM|nr:hypothetical protein [Halanaerobacter jeridensis]
MTLILLLLITPPVVSKDVDFSSQINRLLSEVFNNLEIQSVNAYIAKVEKDKLYLDQGKEGNFSAGDKLVVKRRIDLLKDPITQERLGTINKSLAEISITKIEDHYSIAKITDKLQEDEIKAGDKVMNDKEQVQILLAQFSNSKRLQELTEHIEGKFYSYLTRKKLFGVNSVDISNYRQLDNIEQQGDYLVTGEVYEGRDKIFLKVELYYMNTALTAAEKVISFANKDEVVNYYRQKYINEHTGYRLLFKTDDFAGPSYSLAWGNLKYGSVVVNHGSRIEIMNYDSELTSEYTIENYKRTKYDDYNLVIGDTDKKGGVEIFAENYNYPIQFKVNPPEDKVQVLKKFNRNRPKLIADLNGKTYLVTRDYKGLLKFNLWQQKKFVTDFKIEIGQNEGYRVNLSNLDENKDKELILTSYQEEKGYRLKIYDLDYKLKAQLDKILGAEFVIANLNTNQKPEIYSYSKQNNRIIVFEWQDNKYQQIWQSKKLADDIVDLASGDINKDGKQELLVLVNNDEQSKIYVYDYQTVNDD